MTVEILPADLTNAGDLDQVEGRLRHDARMGILVNNAGDGVLGGFVGQSPDEVAKIISINTTALTRLASAVARRFVEGGEGSIKLWASFASRSTEAELRPSNSPR